MGNPRKNDDSTGKVFNDETKFFILGYINMNHSRQTRVCEEYSANFTDKKHLYEYFITDKLPCVSQRVKRRTLITTDNGASCVLSPLKQTHSLLTHQTQSCFD